MLPEENWFLASTYKAILQRIHDECKGHVEIHLNTPVTEIVSQQTPTSLGRPISVKVAGGESLEFDEIVATVPLGWLKHNKRSFKPPLPVQVSAAIDHIGYGRLEKVYITFEQAFWETHGSSHQQPFIYRFLDPAYAYEQNRDQRSVECFSMAALPQPCKQPTLLFYLNGPTSASLTKMIRNLPRDSKDWQAKLTSYFRPYYSRLPNYHEGHCPLNFCATDWQNDEFAGFGSYSTYQVSEKSDELVELDKDIDILRIGTSSIMHVGACHGSGRLEFCALDLVPTHR